MNPNNSGVLNIDCAHAHKLASDLHRGCQRAPFHFPAPPAGPATFTLARAAQAAAEALSSRQRALCEHGQALAETSHRWTSHIDATDGSLGQAFTGIGGTSWH